MPSLTYTLLADGTSDRALMPILDWLLRKYLPTYAIQPAFAELHRLPYPPKILPERIRASVELYPCDLLFVHRDAEGQSHFQRTEEIRAALEEAKLPAAPPTVCVVPVRMQEAWLLFDAAAIRQAASNPNGKQSLTLPELSQVEYLPDPKQKLHEVLRTASGLGSHRRSKFRVHQSAQRISEYVTDFSPLRALSAFQALEKELGTTLNQIISTP